MSLATEVTPAKAKPTEPEQDAPSIYEMCVEALAQFDNSADSAEDYVSERLATEPSILRAIVRSEMRRAVSAMTTKALADQRRTIFNRFEAAKAGKAVATALAASMKSSLLDIPLADGTRLRDATRAEILSAIDFYTKQASTMAHRARWLQAIASAIPDGRRVGDVISEKKAEELYRKAA